MRRMLIAALALPCLGLAASWVWTDWRTRQGTEWDVPVTGYDPRDLLRGHYVEYRYLWPGVSSRRADIWGPNSNVCIEGPAPRITRARLIRDEPCVHRVRWEQGTGSFEGGRYYVPQANAARIERALMNPAQQAVLRFRLRPDGLIVPMGLSFRAKLASERAAEQALREAEERAGRDAGVQTAPPAINLEPTPSPQP